MESNTHRALKDAARHWLGLHGWRAVACEVHCPINRYKADVAGYLEPLPKGTRRIHRIVESGYEKPQLLGSLLRRSHALTAWASAIGLASAFAAVIFIAAPHAGRVVTPLLMGRRFTLDPARTMAD